MMYKRLVFLAIVWTAVLIMLGAYVRLSDAGLGCPDWPGCYGQLAVPSSEHALAEAQSAYPLQPIDRHKAWKEMAHRYVAGGLGVVIAVIVVVAMTQRAIRQQGLGLPLLIGVMVVLQAALGMWTVTLLLKPAIVTAHLLGGMLLLVGLILLGIRQQYQPRWGAIPLRGFAALVWLTLLAQIALGGWVSSNYAALACYDFPMCQPGLWMPPMDFTDAFHLFRDLGVRADGRYLSLENLTAIHWLHRVGALVLSVLMIGLISQLMRYQQTCFSGLLLLGLLLLQIVLGVVNVMFSLPLFVAVAHNGVAAALLALMTVINGRLWQISAEEP